MPPLASVVRPVRRSRTKTSDRTVGLAACDAFDPAGLTPAQRKRAADRVVIVGAGRLVREGSIAELRAGAEGAGSVVVRSPEAARLLLEHPETVSFLTQETHEAVTTPNALDPTLYFAVRAFRDAAITLAQDRRRSVRDRLALVLLMAARAQTLLSAGKPEAVAPLCTRFLTHGTQERQLLRLRRMRRENAAFFPLWLLLRNMEHLTERFPALLDDCAHAARPDAAFWEGYASRLENLSVYFLFRYVLKAAVDGRLLEKTAACVFHVLAVTRLFPHWDDPSPEGFRTLCGLYSKEVEHSEENLALLYRALRRGALRVGQLLSLL